MSPESFVSNLPGGGEGNLLPPKSYVDVPARPRKSDFLYTNFLPNSPPIYTIFERKAPNFNQIGCFLQ